MKYLRFPYIIALAVLWGCSDKIDDDPVQGVLLAAPTGLSGVAQNYGTEVLLSWTDNSTGESGYRADMSNHAIAATADIQAIKDLPANATSCRWTVSPGVTRYFRVLAVTATRQSKPSGVISVTTPLLPSAPQSFHATAVSTSRIDLSWADVSGETSYRIERSEDGGAAWSTMATPPANTTGYSDTSIASEVEYSYRVLAANANGEGPPSSIATVTPISTAFTISVAATGGDVGMYSCMAVDAAGAEHISFYDYTNADCLYATNAGGTFATVIADWGPAWNTSNVGGNGTSIALDALGHAHIAACEMNNGDLRYITNPTGAFTAVTIDSLGYVGSKPKLKISPLDGSIQIVYLADSSLKRAVSPSAGVWNFETIVSPESIDSVSFVLDSAGAPHIAYLRLKMVGGVLQSEVVYARKSGGAWVFEVVPAGTKPMFPSIAVDPSGAPHIVYYDNNSHDLHHAALESGNWTNELIDPGYHNSIAIDPTVHPGRIHVAYYDLIARDLRYAWKDPGKLWNRRIVDADGFVGSYPSIAVDSLGEVHISYYDETYRRLKRASTAP